MNDLEYAQEWVDRGTDRLGLHVYPDPGEGPFVVVFPAMGVPARYYRPFAADLLRVGLAVAVTDLRGTGSSTPRPSRSSRYGYAELVADVGAVLDTLKPHTDGRPVLLLGHSLGGQACAIHLALSGPDSGVAGLVLVAVGLPYWRDYPAGARTVLPMTQGINAVSAVLGVWPGWRFGGRQARGVIRDWAYTARTGRYPALDGVDVEAALATVRTPVLAVTVEHDQYTPASTMDRLCAKLRAAPIEREDYTAAQAGGPLDHFRWVRAAGPLASRIATFAAACRPSR
ncbi:MAG: alpha/beta fold hydrolase [Micromonosporaceae bacterium]|nr:alpha/beta fold hydrolase [Micromonosporaceae bacterium]